jgi:UDP-N-acetylglucosamine 2-epimerase (non-hydrolysing)
MKKVLFVFGTRPEAIKLAPVILAMKKSSDFETRVCLTSQHKTMLRQVMEVFDLTEDIDLDLMKENQSLEGLTSRVLLGISEVLSTENPALVVVQGDTTTVFAAALAAFYKKIPVAHIEAGLRSHNKYSPFPEEVNRVLTTHISTFHFTPTALGKRNLMGEGIPEERIYVVGNTVLDALLSILEKVREKSEYYRPKFNFPSTGEAIRRILVTGHRRENFGEGFLNICKAIRRIAETESVEIVYPVHLNPNVREPVYQLLGGMTNIHLIEPVSYDEMVYLMDSAYLILTDSGGIQEEAPTLDKPVLVMRSETERPEGVDAGVLRIVGTNEDKIVDEVRELLHSEEQYREMSGKPNPYGDGQSAPRIVQIFELILQ